MMESNTNHPEWQDFNEGVKYVCDGAKIQCPYCVSIGVLKVTSTKIKLQDKLQATTGDKIGAVNLKFAGACLHPSQQKPLSFPPSCQNIINLGSWENYSDTYLNNEHALLVRSTIKCNISCTPIRIIHSGQTATLNNLNKMDSPVMGNIIIQPDCTEVTKRILQKEVQKYCKGEPTKCNPMDECATLERKMHIAMQCIQARTRINMRCYQGGDRGHQQAIEEWIFSLVKCQSIYFPKCANMPQRVQEAEPIPQVDDSFMKQMEAITGLTGTALIIYLIVSEGSRLFPPRNLVPIP